MLIFEINGKKLNIQKISRICIILILRKLLAAKLAPHVYNV